MTEPSRDDREPGITPGADLPVALDDRPLLSDRPRSPFTGLIWAAILVLAIVLFKYAIDLLFVFVVLGCVGFLLNLLIKWLVETELLTPAWAIILLLMIAVMSWMGWPLVSSISPADAVERSLHFERVLPAGAVRFLAWAEQHGWAQRVLVPMDVATEERILGGGTGVSVALTSSHKAARVGQPFTFTATLRFSVPPAAGTSTTVEFWDGGTALGAVSLRLADDTAVASMTTAALAPGTHSITARYVGPLLVGCVTSPAVTVTVTP